MSYDQITAEDAWRKAIGNKSSEWHRNIFRFDQAFHELSLKPKFLLSRESRIFCMGSCFARNIEEHLMYRDVNVLSKRIVAPLNEAPNRPTGLVNKFTTHSMTQELQWLVAPLANYDDALLETGKGWLDLQLTPGGKAVSYERARERRCYMTEDYFARIKQADTLILTLGLNEVWYDRQHDIWLNSAPPYYETKRQPDRFELHITDVNENTEQLGKLRQLFRAFNPKARIIITVSPVPMGATFSGSDVAVANSLSKSTLRAAAQNFCAQYEDVEYFPSYEFVTLMPRDIAYNTDKLHVRHEVVAQVMSRFLEAYMGFEDGAAGPFREKFYLEANPDIEAQVRAGELESGYAHWKSEGRAQNRPLKVSTL